MDDLRVDRPSAAEAKALVESQGLAFDAQVDDLAGLYEEGRLAACGARLGYVLKMLVVHPSHQGTDALAMLVTRLVQGAREAGEDTVFVFTPPRNAGSFEALNFRLLAAEGESALLEHGPGLQAYLAAAAPVIAPGHNGAVVVNGNPFTLGHLRLIERAAAEVDRLYVFIVREDRSAFPFAVRFRLAGEATRHLPNVTVLDTSRYAVSAGTFPSYFLKRLDAVARAQMRLDAALFARRIAPAFHVARRYVGEEPLCPATSAYNQALAEALVPEGVEFAVIPRAASGGLPISATRVRAAFAEGDLEALPDLVPPATLAFLRSPEAGPIAQRLRAQMKET